MDLRTRLIAAGPNLALVGVGLIVLICLATALAYSGPEGEAYSPLNHTVSELGERGVSALATVFNVGMVVSGSLIALYMLSLVLRFDDRGGRGVGLLGTAAGVAMALVGVFPVDDLEPHIAVAAVAFLLVLATALWFAVWSLRGGAPYPGWTGWFAAGIVVLVVVFLFLPSIVQPEYSFEMDFTAEVPRPDVLLNSTLEWAVILSAWAWIATLAFYDRRRLRGAAS